MKILKTLVGKVAVGFVFVLALMVGTTYVAVTNQQKIGSEFQSLSADVLPLLQLTYDMKGYIQNSNKAVSQHAAIEDLEVLPTFVEEFNSTQAQYRSTLDSVLSQLDSSSPLRAKLEEADVLAQQSLTLGAQHLTTHNEILTVTQKFNESYQAVSSRWLQFDGDMRLVETTINRLKNEEDPNAIQVEIDGRTIMEKLRLIRTTSAAVVGITDMDTLEITINNLKRNTDAILKNLANLEETANYAHRKAKPYVELAQGMTGNEDSLFDLYVRMNEAEDEGTALLNELGVVVNQTLALQEAIIDDVAAITTQTSAAVKSTNDSAFVTLMGVLGVSLILGGLIIWSVLRAIRKPLKAITKVLRGVADGDLSQQITVIQKDEFGQIAEGLNGLIEHLREIIQDISENAGVIEEVTERVSANTKNSLTKLQDQKDKSQTIVSATQVLTDSSEQISEGASATLNEVQDVSQSAMQSKDNVKSSLNYVNELVEGLKYAGSVIDNLQKESDNISQILTTIQGIAEQTNLLALNAAIEAARAGEQGRGFAVVADEVRNLASKTQASTEEIYAMIDSFQKQSNAAAQTMEKNMSRIDTLVENSNVTDQSVQAILDSITQINAKSESIDMQTSEQKQTVSDVARDIERIAQIADEIYGNASKNADSFKELSELVQRQSQSVSLFRLT